MAHAGTFNGHLAAAVAGSVTLAHLDAAAIGRLTTAAGRLAARITAAAVDAAVNAHVTRTSTPARRDSRPTSTWHCCSTASTPTPRGMINLSTVHTAADLDNAAAAYARPVARVARAGSHRPA